MANLLSKNPESQELGPLISHHRFSPLQLVVASVIFGGLGVFSISMMFQGLTGYIQESREGADRSGSIFVLVFFGTLLLVVTIIAWKSFKGFRQRIQLHRDGFISIWGDQYDVFRWDEIQGIQQRSIVYTLNFVPVSSFRSITVQRQDGKQVEVNGNLDDAAQLGAVILQRSYECMISVKWDALQKGQDVPFGPITINQQGLRLRKSTLHWEKLKRLTFEDGKVFAQRTDGEKVWGITMKHVPNLHVLAGIIDHMQRPPV